MINPKGEILDRASPALSDIRHRLASVREKAKTALERLLHQEELQPVFQEPLITLRSGRYVLLIKSEHKHRLEGIIHDQSQSRMTFFLEPLPIVSLNNEISILISEEKEEEHRILSELSDRVRSEIDSLWRDLEILGELDFLHAMARLSTRFNSIRPMLNEEAKIDMKEARNPFLILQNEEMLVPIHLRVGDGIRTLILSGANAGGKTVALKTLGLLTLMVQSGLPIPVAEGSRVGVFEEIFAVIGDEQSIGENLSTFSSHLLHVNEVIEKAGPRSLVLVDELGVGTNAAEGCALAMGFLTHLREKGATAVITTHFDGLKAYGYLHPDVENVAVQFDEKTLEPRYILSYGSSGLSNAFLVAEKLGISQRVLEMAREYRAGGDQQVARTLETLERFKTEVEKEQQETLKVKEEARRERQRLKEFLEGIKKRKQEIFSRAEEQANRALQRTEEELKEWVRGQKAERTVSSIRRPGLHHKEIQSVKEKHFPSVKREVSSTTPNGLKAGERVKIMSLRSHGVVLSVEEPLNQVEVMTAKAKVKTSLSDIARVTEGEEERETEVSKGHLFPRETVQEPPTRLNVIGLTVEDALPQVDKFIDQALLHGLEKVQVIHGVGSGRLRSAIAQYLRDHRGVKAFSPGEATKGGHGVTVVELR